MACSSSSNGGDGSNGGAAGAVATGGAAPVGNGGAVTASGGQPAVTSTGGTTQVGPIGNGGTNPIGMGGATMMGAGGMMMMGGGGTSAGGSTGTSGAAGNGGTAAGGASMGGSSNGGSSGAGGASGGGSASLTGMLGALGAVKPIVNAWVISNSGETLIYLSSAPLTCMMMQTMGVGWLSKLPAGSQVIEIVVKGTPSAKMYPVGLLQGEVNYAPGGMSSNYETSASSGSITFTMASANGPVEGTVMATYAMGSVMGTFHAEFCSMGSQY